MIKVRDYYATEADFLLSQGLTPARVAERLGVNAGSLARALYREGRGDIGRLFKRAERAMAA